MEPDLAAPSVARQARAYLAVEEARLALTRAQSELREAEKQRLRPLTPLTIIIDGQAITSHRASPDKWAYQVSKVV